MPYVNIHIDVDEFYDELDRHDKKELVKYLEQDGILEQCKVVEFGDLEAKIGSPLDFEWVAMKGTGSAESVRPRAIRNEQAYNKWFKTQ